MNNQIKTQLWFTQKFYELHKLLSSTPIPLITKICFVSLTGIAWLRQLPLIVRP